MHKKIPIRGRRRAVVIGTSKMHNIRAAPLGACTRDDAPAGRSGVAPLSAATPCRVYEHETNVLIYQRHD